MARSATTSVKPPPTNPTACSGDLGVDGAKKRYKAAQTTFLKHQWEIEVGAKITATQFAREIIHASEEAVVFPCSGGRGGMAGGIVDEEEEVDEQCGDACCDRRDARVFGSANATAHELCLALRTELDRGFISLVAGQAWGVNKLVGVRLICLRPNLNGTINLRSSAAAPPPIFFVSLVSQGPKFEPTAAIPKDDMCTATMLLWCPLRRWTDGQEWGRKVTRLGTIWGRVSGPLSRKLRSTNY